MLHNDSEVVGGDTRMRGLLGISKVSVLENDKVSYGSKHLTIYIDDESDS